MTLVDDFEGCAVLSHVPHIRLIKVNQTFLELFVGETCLVCTVPDQIHWEDELMECGGGGLSGDSGSSMGLCQIPDEGIQSGHRFIRSIHDIDTNGNVPGGVHAERSDGVDGGTRNGHQSHGFINIRLENGVSEEEFSLNGE